MKSQTEISKLHSKINFRGPSDCWLWKGVVSEGFGRFTINKRQHMPHRLMYELEYGAIPDGMVISRLCDDQLCCNPCHMAMKPKWHVSIENLPTESHRASAKLDEDDVREVRAEHARGDVSFADLGRQFMVTAPTIRAVVTRQTWKHVI